jgi:hypothetical protein
MTSPLPSATLVSVKIGLTHFAEDGVLSTLEQAVKARAQIEKELAAQTSGGPVELDFNGVRAVTVTFADEGIGRVLGSRLAGYDEDHPFFAVGANQEVRVTLAAALRQRKLSLLSFNDGQVELLGGDETLTSTMEQAVALGSFSVNELAERLGLTAQAANNRLTQLVRVGALSRSRVIPSRGGREFRYEVPPPARRSRPLRPRAAASAR